MTQHRIKADTKGMKFEQAAAYLNRLNGLTCIRNMSTERLFRVDSLSADFGYVSVCMKSLLDDSADVRFIPNK